MDLQLSENAAAGGPWTNEKHFHFLNTVEASFVRTMLENSGVNDGRRLLRLDRQLPDTSDSTLDLKTHRRRQHVTSSSGDINFGETRQTVQHRVDRRSRRSFHVSSQDQVVPDVGDRSGDKDEREHHGNVAVTSMSAAS